MCFSVYRLTRLQNFCFIVFRCPITRTEFVLLMLFIGVHPDHSPNCLKINDLATDIWVNSHNSLFIMISFRWDNFKVVPEEDPSTSFTSLFYFLLVAVLWLHPNLKKFNLGYISWSRYTRAQVLFLIKLSRICWLH